ncbi:MAG: hypothetical protein IMZ46_20435 [Acidobacteria bacterium]|nr:hypothetical protein [Acidobacteriota bacterium]
MSLYTDWDDLKSANSRMRPMGKPWGYYSSRPARGVNVSGWLFLEPFIAP